MINTNALKQNQIFNNYKEICEFLGEPSYQGGKQRQLQLKDWERYFRWEKQGYKFIITEVFDTPKEKIDKRGGNNNKNVKPMMDYLMAEFDTKYANKYHTISNWSTTVLHLMNKDACDKTYRDDDELFAYCGERKLLDPTLYREYVSTVKMITKNLITTAFRGLQKKGCIKYDEGYTFRYEGEKHPDMVSTNLLNDYIDNMEREICQEIQNEFYADKDIKGKQLVYVIQRNKNKELSKLYKDMRMECMNASDEVCSTINDAIWDKDANSRDFVDGEDKRLLYYFKSYQITEFDENYTVDDKEKLKQEVIEIIQNLALRAMLKQNYVTKWGEIIYPYDNPTTLDEIRKINNVLFRDVKKVVTPMDIVEEVFDEYELDRIFNMEYLAS